jgi:hypothetical protein
MFVAEKSFHPLREGIEVTFQIAFLTSYEAVRGVSPQSTSLSNWAQRPAISARGSVSSLLMGLSKRREAAPPACSIYNVRTSSPPTQSRTPAQLKSLASMNACP